MAAQRIELIPLGTFNNGTRNFGPRNLNDNIIGLVFEFQRCTTLTPTIWSNPASFIDAELELSLDGGLSWLGAGGMGAFGGIYVRRDGSEAADSYLLVDLLPAVNSITRQIRGRVTLTGGPIDTSVSVVVDSVRVRDIVRPPR